MEYYLLGHLPCRRIYVYMFTREIEKTGTHHATAYTRTTQTDRRGLRRRRTCSLVQDPGYTCYNPQVPIRPCINPSNRAICLHADYKVIRWNGSKRKVRTYRLTYLLGLFSLFFPGRVALHPFSAHYYITSSNNDGRKQKHTPHYLQCFNSDAGRRRNETGSPQTDQSMSNRSGGMKATATGNVRREQP
jgi:hypothetical protein